jgi:CheY-like chemotaxis protein
MATLRIANNGVEAINVLQHFKPEMIFMDIQMPKMNGIDCCRKIKHDDPLIPIVAITANVMPEEQAKYKREGFDDFMPKPFELGALYSLLNKYLDTTKLRRRV